MNPTLAWRCHLADDESLSSWVSRLAWVNGENSAAEFCLDMGFTLNACARGKTAALAKLQRLTGTPLSSLQRASVTVDGPDIRLRGVQVSPRMLRRSTVTLCPRCIAGDMAREHNLQHRGGGITEAAYGRILWRLTVVRRCPQHECALVTIPHDRTVSIHDLSAHFRHSWDDIRRRADDPERWTSSPLQAYVEDRLEGRDRAASWLDGMPLHAAVETCEEFGLLLTLGATARITHTSEADLHHASGVGFSVATDGEVAIRAALSKTQANFPAICRKRQGSYTVFGPLYRAMAKRQSDPAFEPICAVIRRHIIETTAVGPGESVLGQPVEIRHRHSIQTASRETGRHPVRLRKVLAAAGVIAADHARFSDHHVLFPASGTEQFLTAEVDGLGVIEASKYLQTSARQAYVLARDGFFQAYVEHRGGDNTRRPTFARAELDRFVASLLDGAKAVDTPTPTMLSIPVAAKRTKCEAAVIVRWILERRLRWVGRHTAYERYASVLVDLREIEVLAYAVGDLVTIREAAILLRKHRPIVDGLIRDGHLAAVTVTLPANNIPARMIRRADITTFAKTFVCTGELARTIRIRPERIATLMGGVHPVIDRHAVGIDFYRRETLPDAIHALQIRPSVDVTMLAIIREAGRITAQALIARAVAEGWTASAANKAKQKLKSEGRAISDKGVWTLPCQRPP